MHLHVHSEYSLLDGACRIDRLPAYIKSLGQPAVAITDHSVMYGVMDFYKAAKKAGVKPIIGCEIYVAPRTRFDKVHKVDSSPHHLVLLCKNEEGYKNLSVLVSKASIEGFYSKPRVDLELLRRYSGGLVCLSACLSGQIPRLLAADDYAGALATALEYKEIFGAQNYFIEIQNHGIELQSRILPALVRLSKEAGVGLVASNDAHYIKKEDAEMQNILMCIQTGKTVGEDSAPEFPTQEFYIKTRAEMQAALGNLPEAFENTLKIADMCNLEFEFGKTKLPVFTAPAGEDNTKYFRRLCEEGLVRLYGENPDAKITERLMFEIGTIERMGYVDYFLIVADFVSYAKGRNIPVGPGRGSGAGSLCAYCMGITGVDPIKFSLLFERFLNPERVSMPDFDIDFCYERRQEVIDYVIEKYGADHVAQIITFGTMAARAAIRDTGRALGISYQTVDRTAKLVPHRLNITIEDALAQTGGENVPTLRKAYDSSPEIKKLIDMSRAVEGMPRHASTHAAGVVITDKKTEEYVPLQKSEDVIVTQYTMGTLEELGLLKMDFLGLRYLTVIDYAEKAVQKNLPDFDIKNIPEDDEEVFDMLSAGQAVGVFQFESGGMIRVLSQLGPKSLEDLIAVISLYRPGPMESIPKFIRNRHHPSEVTYAHPKLVPILDVTNACIVYQEQVMQILRELAGYSLGRADIVRRAMSKKKHDVMERERDIFINGYVNEKGEIEVPGCVRGGVDEKVARTVFDEISSFASYAFNKSHAAAYAVVAYRTAYLKCKFPKEYMAALLTSVADSTDRINEYSAECKRIGIPVFGPDINKSGMGFSADDIGIRYGLLAIKNLGRGLIEEILAERKAGGNFTGFTDLINRCGGRNLNKRVIENLIKSGSLDGFGQNRRQLLASYGEITSAAEKAAAERMSGQMNFFDNLAAGSTPEFIYPDCEEFDTFALLKMEKESVGRFISGHPLMRFEQAARKARMAEIHEITGTEDEKIGRFKDGDSVRILALVNGKKLKTTKNNDTMAFVDLEDTSASVEMLVFPKLLTEFGRLLEEGASVVVEGRISVEEEESVKIICGRVYDAESYFAKSISAGAPAAPQKKKTARSGLYLRMECEDERRLGRIKNLLNIFEGNTPVFIRYTDTGKLVAAPKSFYTHVNDTLLKELREILGEENVAHIK